MNIQEVKENARWAFVDENVSWETEPRRNGLVIITGWYFGEDISLPYVEGEGDPDRVRRDIVTMFMRHGPKARGLQAAVLSAVREAVAEGAVFRVHEPAAGDYVEVSIESGGASCAKKVAPEDMGRVPPTAFFADVRRELVDSIARSL